MSNQITRKQSSGLFVSVFWFLIRLVLILLFAGIGFFLISYLFILFRGELWSVDWLQKIYHEQLSYFQGLASVSFLSINFHHFATSINEYFYRFLTSINIQSNILSHWIMFATDILLMRLALLAMALPLFVCAGLFGLVDGLTQRYVRRVSGGHESALLYHYSKSMMAWSVLMTCFIFLALPTSFYPGLVLFPCAILFFLSVKLTAQLFKKYL